MSDDHDEDEQSLGLELRIAIRDALEARGATQPCPRCGQDNFEVIDAFFHHVYQFDAMHLSSQGKGVVTAVVGCVNCGWLCQHATNLLGVTRTRCQIEAEQKG